MKNIRAHLALVAVTIFYGLNYNIAKGIMPDFLAPMTLTFLRISFGVILFYIVNLIYSNKEKVERKDLVKILICGLTGVTLNQSLFLYGLSLTSPINASIIVISTPVMVFVFSYFMLKEKITLKKAFGILLGLAGSWLLILNSKNSGKLTVNFYGDILIVLNVISFSFYLVFVKSLMKKYKPITLVKWVFLFGLISITPLAFQDVAQTNWSEIPFEIYMSIVYVVLFATFGTYMLNMYALSRVNASVVGFYIYFQVIIATAVAVYLGNDTLDHIKVISCLLIFIAVFLVGNFNLRNALSERKNFNQSDRI